MGRDRERAGDRQRATAFGFTYTTREETRCAREGGEAHTESRTRGEINANAVRNSENPTELPRRNIIISERICLVVNDLPSAESKGAVPAVRRGPPSECVPAHTSPRTRATTHTLYTLVYTAALALSSEPALLAWPVHCIGLHSLAVSRVRLRGVVLSSVGVLSCLSLSYIITRVAPHCVNTLRILHAAYDATNTTRPLVNTHSVR